MNSGTFVDFRRPLLVPIYQFKTTLAVDLMVMSHERYFSFQFWETVKIIVLFKYIVFKTVHSIFATNLSYETK